MKICTVVGARPQFIKAAAVSRILREQAQEVLIHTGQHYDYNMSDVFFEEMDIPQPDYNLGIAGGSHGQMTGRMLTAIEEVLLQERPDMLLVYGDTNSTMAAALAAAKLHIPVCHVEAGNRLGTLSNPEEINRITTDHVSSLLMCCVPSAVEFLAQENLTRNVLLVGDPMYDAFVYYSSRLAEKDRNNIVDLAGNAVSVPQNYYYLTCHREENTADDAPLTEILKAMDSLDAPVIYPVHPRNQARARRLCSSEGFTNVIFAQPVGYLTSIALVNGAKKVITDSGGLQREAFFAGVQCVTVFDYVAWPETMVNNCNQLAKADAGDILHKLAAPCAFDSGYMPFGDGHAGNKIVAAIIEFLNDTGK